MQHKCQNCDAIHGEDDLKPIKNYDERVAPGETVPSGECPECGALCHPYEPDGLRQATEEEIQQVREEWDSDDIAIDPDAKATNTEDGAVWVQAWIRLEPQS